MSTRNAASAASFPLSLTERVINLDLGSVQELMGHKTLTMTLRYAHLSTEHRLAAVRLLDAPSGGRTGTREHLHRQHVRAPRSRSHRTTDENPG